MRKSDKWFTIIELLVWIFIFSMGLLSIYYTIHQSLKLNDMSRDNIIASNLAREWVELIKNTRDSNYSNIHAWNLKNPLKNWEVTDSEKFGLTEEYFKISNNFESTSNHTVKFEEISQFKEWNDKLAEMEKYRLFLDSKNRYVYDNGITPNLKATPFYRYVKIEPAGYKTSGGIDKAIDWVIITSKVIWVHWGYHETEIKSVLTNWMRQ